MFILEKDNSWKDTYSEPLIRSFTEGLSFWQRNKKRVISWSTVVTTTLEKAIGIQKITGNGYNR